LDSEWLGQTNTVISSAKSVLRMRAHMCVHTVQCTSTHTEVEIVRCLPATEARTHGIPAPAAADDCLQ